MSEPRRPTVLVVDDEEDLIVALRLLLTHSGYRVVGAMRGDDALRIVREDAPDLVVLDLRMDHVNGFTVLSRMQDDTALDGIPVIVLSAHASPRTIERAHALGCRDFVTKPFDADDLIERIRAALTDP